MDAKEELFALLDSYPDRAEPLLAAIVEDRIHGMDYFDVKDHKPVRCVYGHVLNITRSNFNGSVIDRVRKEIGDIYDGHRLEEFVAPIRPEKDRFTDTQKAKSPERLATLRTWVEEWIAVNSVGAFHD